jgi:CheY-like chemotaxis protein
MTLPEWKRANEVSRPAATEAAASPQPETWTRTLLLVEDNAYLAAMAEMLLETLGYKIKYASTACQALDILNGGATVDAVFTDILMPGGLSGIEFAKMVRDRSPDLPIVLTTGSPAAAAEARAQGFVVLERPCPVDVLESALRSALAQSSPEGETGGAPLLSGAVITLTRKQVA